MTAARTLLLAVLVVGCGPRLAYGDVWVAAAHGRLVAERQLHLNVHTIAMRQQISLAQQVHLQRLTPLPALTWNHRATDDYEVISKSARLAAAFFPREAFGVPALKAVAAYTSMLSIGAESPSASPLSLWAAGAGVFLKSTATEFGPLAPAAGTVLTAVHEFEKYRSNPFQTRMVVIETGWRALAAGLLSGAVAHAGGGIAAPVAVGLVGLTDALLKPESQTFFRNVGEHWDTPGGPIAYLTRPQAPPAVQQLTQRISISTTTYKSAQTWSMPPLHTASPALAAALQRVLPISTAQYGSRPISLPLARLSLLQPTGQHWSRSLSSGMSLGTSILTSHWYTTATLRPGTIYAPQVGRPIIGR